MAYQFPDLNQWHRVTDWPTFAQAYPVAACKATEGDDFVDPYWSEFLAGCQRHGIVPIAYHRLRREQTSERQAAHCIRAVPAGCGLAVDVETKKLPDGTTSEPRMTDASRFLTIISEAYGRPRSQLLSYLPRWWWNSQGGGSQALRDTLLWASRYATPIDWTPYAGFPTMTLMQYSSTHPIVGGDGPGDHNEFRGSADELRGLLGLATGGWWTRPLGAAELAQLRGAFVGALQ